MGAVLGGMILLAGAALFPTARVSLAGLRLIFKKEQGGGQLSAFGTLCTTLAATLGTGNIVGVSSAILLGGPGAWFWMVAGSFLCMILKYGECVLGVRYRRRGTAGFEGGAFYYIAETLGRKAAKMFAFCGALAGAMGLGTLTQADGIVRTLQRHLDPTRQFSVMGVPLVGLLAAGTVAGLVGAVLCGGLKRISALCEAVVPLMSVGYILCCGIILIRYAPQAPDALKRIVCDAFSFRAGFGGWVGTVSAGISRGIFSNEAGLGSASITAAAAQGDSPHRQGLIGQAGVFIDTTVMCTLSGLCVVVTDARGADGAAVTSAAFGAALGPVGEIAPGIFLCFFAFTTIVGWYYYAERCFCYLTDGRWERGFRFLYVGMILLTPLMDSSRIWRLADLLNCGMALPNLLALWRLRRQIAAENSQKNTCK